jgi:hypothetical protein
MKITKLKNINLCITGAREGHCLDRSIISNKQASNLKEEGGKMKKAIGLLLVAVFFTIQGWAQVIPDGDILPPAGDFQLSLSSGSVQEEAVKRAVEKFLETQSVTKFFQDIAAAQGTMAAPIISELAVSIANRLNENAGSWAAANARLTTALRSGDANFVLDIGLSVMGIESTDVVRPQFQETTLTESIKELVNPENIDDATLKGTANVAALRSQASTEDEDAAWNATFNDWVTKLGFAEEDAGMAAKRVISLFTGLTLEEIDSDSFESISTAIRGENTGKMVNFLEAAL